MKNTHNYNVRDAEYRNTEHTMIDVILDHPEFGEIPYSYNTKTESESLDEVVLNALPSLTIKDYVAYVPSQSELDERSVAVAKQFLADTDWIGSKILDMQLLGQNIQVYLDKYADILSEREDARNTINQFE